MRLVLAVVAALWIGAIFGYYDGWQHCRLADQAVLWHFMSAETLRPMPPARPAAASPRAYVLPIVPAMSNELDVPGAYAERHK